MQYRYNQFVILPEPDGSTSTYTILQECFDTLKEAQEFQRLYERVVENDPSVIALKKYLKRFIDTVE